VKTNQADYPVRAMCRVLGLSPSGYYAWIQRPPSARARRDAELVARIMKIHDDNRQVYGRPRIYAELKDEGERVGEKRVGRLMRQEGIWGVSRRRRGPKTTKRNADARPAADLVERDFTADGPDQLWVADITYIPTWAGFLYLAVVLDAWSRKIVGWAMATHLRTELVLDAMNMAVYQRRPEAVIHHSDQGTQYTSIAFGLRCKEVDVRPSMGSVGDAYDNAMCESFFASLECELLERQRFATQAEARMAVFDYIEGFYNPRRRHSSLGQIAPANFERLHRDAARAEAA
jgi:putative transposase